MPHTDKLWPTDKYGFKFAYAIKLKTKWMVKRSGGDWETRQPYWNPFNEPMWCKFILFGSLQYVERTIP